MNVCSVIKKIHFFGLFCFTVCILKSFFLFFFETFLKSTPTVGGLCPVWVDNSSGCSAQISIWTDGIKKKKERKKRDIAKRQTSDTFTDFLGGRRRRGGSRVGREIQKKQEIKAESGPEFEGRAALAPLPSPRLLLPGVGGAALQEDVREGQRRTRDNLTTPKNTDCY